MGVSGQRHARQQFTPGEMSPISPWIGRWVGRRAGHDTEVRGKILWLCWGSNHDHTVVQSVVRHEHSQYWFTRTWHRVGYWVIDTFWCLVVKWQEDNVVCYENMNGIRKKLTCYAFHKSVVPFVGILSNTCFTHVRLWYVNTGNKLFTVCSLWPLFYI
jgi:hypothetical protein